MAKTTKPVLSQNVIQQMQQNRCQFNEAQATPHAANAYVVWLDLMGAGNAMCRSLPKAANFIMRIHDAALHAAQGNAGVTLYPFNDGVYVIAVDQDPIMQFLRKAMWRLADQFIIEANHEHRCLVRGAIAFGRVLQGNKLAAGVLGGNQNQAYLNAIVMGMPIGQAYRAEHEAAPYGVIVHESARGFAPANSSPLGYVFWKWFDDNNASHTAKMNAFRWHLADYFGWLEKHHRAQLYELEALKRHRAIAEEYFAI